MTSPRADGARRDAAPAPAGGRDRCGDRGARGRVAPWWRSPAPAVTADPTPTGPRRALPSSTTRAHAHHEPRAGRRRAAPTTTTRRSTSTASTRSAPGRSRSSTPTRPTSANGDFGGAPTRTLPTEFWYPAEGAGGGSRRPTPPPTGRTARIHWWCSRTATTSPPTSTRRCSSGGPRPASSWPRRCTRS